MSLDFETALQVAMFALAFGAMYLGLLSDSL